MQLLIILESLSLILILAGLWHMGTNDVDDYPFIIDLIMVNAPNEGVSFQSEIYGRILLRSLAFFGAAYLSPYFLLAALLTVGYSNNG